MRLILKPDWDPNNPYHYHVNGQKVVVTPEDWEKYKNDPTFREVRTAVEAEQAAYPEPEYDEVENPAWRKAYQNLVNGVNLRGRSNYLQPLPQGYTRDNKGVVMDSEGNYYLPVETATNAPYFINQERGTMGHTVPVRYELQQMPDRTIRLLRQPLPVDRMLDVGEEREKAINDYIKSTSSGKYYFPTLYDGDIEARGWDYRNRKWTESADGKKLYTRQEYNKLANEFIDFLTKEGDSSKEKWQFIKDLKDGNLFYRKPSRQEAEKKAVIKVGDLEKVGTFAKGGKLIKRCLNGERVNMSKLVTNSKGIPLKVDNNLLEELDNFLIKQNVGLPLRLAILYTVVQEGSTAGSHGNGAYGYLGWRGSRIPGKGVNQMQYLYDTIFGEFNKDLWNHGGVGSGYMSGREALQSFINATNVNDALRSLNYGYVRPELELREFRSKTKYFNEDEEVN